MTILTLQHLLSKPETPFALSAKQAGVCPIDKAYVVIGRDARRPSLILIRAGNSQLKLNQTDEVWPLTNVILS